MLLALSPAKTLDFERPDPPLPLSRPVFARQAQALIDLLRERSVGQIAALMDLSDALATLNVERYQAWRPRHDAHNAKAALLAFDGDVYHGLQAPTLEVEALTWANEHLVMLSGLYGVLRPLDRIQPYRLEMGTRLPSERGKDLYAYWGRTIADHLNRRQAGQRDRVLVNLASDEYFRAVDRRVLKARVVQCVFEDWQRDDYRIVSFWAKRARGRMARFAIDHRIDAPEGLRAFDADGYRFDAGASEADRLVFRRREPPSGDGAKG